MTSPSRPDLRVEVPSETSAPPAQGSDGSSTNSKVWGKMLQSPQAFIEKTASFTAKLAGRKPAKHNAAMPQARHRTSVEPYRRAAMDAEYRTNLALRQVSMLSCTFSPLPANIFFFLLVLW
jgi:hypothetical protein